MVYNAAVLAVLPPNTYMAIMAVAALVSLMLGSRAWMGARKSLSRSFALYELSVFIWCLFAVVEWAVPGPESRYEALRLQYIGIAFVPSACFLFAHALASRPIRFPLAILPLLPGLLFSLVIATNGGHHAFWLEERVGSNWAEPPYGWGFWAFLAYSYSMIALSLAIIAMAARRAKGVYARWLWLILGFFLLPFMANAIYVLTIAGKTGYDLTPIALAVSGFLMAYIMGRFDVFDPLPYAKSVILESIDTPMLVVDVGDFVVGANHEANRIFARHGALEGLPVSSLVPSYVPSMGDRDTMRWSNGDVDYLMTCYVVQRDRADWRGRLILFRDISELSRASRELEEARAKAEAASASKSAFVAVVSHELRNPLGAIIGVADLNLRRDCPQAFRSDFETIRSAGRLLLGIVNDLLDISKMEAGRLELESADFDLVERAMSVTRAYAPTAAAKGLDLKAVAEDGIPRFVKGDPQRFEQVLMNLLGNAVKFTQKGEVVVRLAPNPVDLRDGDPRVLGALVEVRDTGIGISPAGKERLFKDFSQADKSIATRFGGTGLGLSVSKRIACLMGGEISVESQEGVGSVFSFTARFEPGLPERVAATIGEERGRERPSKALRILVVDDDPAGAEVARRYAEGLGHGVVCAGTGAEAIGLLLAGDFDLALMDIGLPDMDGLDAVRRVRVEGAEAGSRPLAIAAMTASVEPDLFSRCESAGVDDLLPKPLDPERLERFLERVARDRGPPGRRAEPPESSQPARSRKYMLIDKDALLARLGGDTAFMRKILSIFVDEAPSRVDSIDAAVAARDLEALRCAVHGIHGASLTLRAEPLSVASGSIEAGIIEAMKEPGFHDFEVYAESLKVLLGHTVKAARAAIEKLDVAGVPDPT